MARKACPASAWRWAPGPSLMNEDLASAKRDARSVMTDSARPVAAAARSTGHSAARARSSSAPVVLSARKSVSSQPLAKITWSRPSASAPSLPGRGARWMSDARAVFVRTGSMQTMVAPRLRACRKYGQKCRWVDTMLAPQATTRSASATDSMSVAGHPAG